MIDRDLIRSFESGLPNEDLFDLIAGYLEEDKLGTVLIPYDDTDEYSNNGFRLKLNGFLRNYFMLPSFQIASNLVKVNNMIIIYGISAQDALETLKSGWKSGNNGNK